MCGTKFFVAITLVLGMAFSGSGRANTLTAQVADYNAAQVKGTNGVVVVPAAVATYAVTTAALTNGSTFTVTLPANFSFASDPSLTDTGTSTFALTGSGIGSQSATFTVGTADLATGQSLSLASFSVSGATALETPIPVANALSISMQSIGNDPTPLTVGAFASEPGITAIFVGAIQFIDTSPPSLGTLFQSAPDTPTAVIDAVAISAQTVDAATSHTAVLSPNGMPNKLLNADTASVTVSGKWTGIATAFASTTSDCKNPTVTGTVAASEFTIPNVPFDMEVFFCVTANGTTQLPFNLNGYAPVTVTPGSSTDFQAASANVEFGGVIAYTGTPLSPTLSKAFGAASIPFNGTTSLTFNLSNPNMPGGQSIPELGTTSPTPLTGVAFSDTLPPGMVVATPNGLTGSCGGGTITATAGSGSVSLAGATLSDGGVSCAFSVNVTANAVGAMVNTTGAVTSTQSGTGATASASITVTPAANAITFALLPSSVVFGAAPLALSATASSALPVTFTATGPATISANTLIITGAGTVVVTASQAGNADYVAATPVSQTIAVNTTSSSVTLTGSPNPANAGQAVTFTATVTGGAVPTSAGRFSAASMSSKAVPTGSVAFADNGTTLANVALDPSGSATFTISSLSAGTHTITATYSGDANTAAATGSLTEQINATAPTASVTPAPASSTGMLGLLAIFLALIGSAAAARRRTRRVG